MICETSLEERETAFAVREIVLPSAFVESGLRGTAAVLEEFTVSFSHEAFLVLRFDEAKVLAHIL